MKAGQALLMFALGGLIVFALLYAHYSGLLATQWQEAWQAGYEAGQAAVPPAVEPVSLTITQTGGTEFNFSTDILSDGSATANSTKLLLTLANTDNRTANIIITAKNPKTGEEGIPSGLENAYFNVFVGDDVLKYLFFDGIYTDGKSLTLEPASVVSLYIGAEVEDAPAGTFADNQTYTMDIFIYQPDSNYVQEISYTVLT